ncbi:uncharacterized protein LOC132282559 isoform X2 [Cornus florida]|uniref:uncharacterized protein LOC132282559 isoform X2 n=1 Tax=Cornus florida TaxID=4283 RepID=UPI0028A28133|nr:uncharacterized protein LOC132282559 isoform X2 [Cornus florida]
MVAISLYRGNLHRVPDAPRRWLMPTPKISLKDFKILLHRRSTALSRLLTTTTTIATTSNPNPKDNEFSSNEPQPPPSEPPRVSNPEEGPSSFQEEVKDHRGSDGGGGGSEKPVDGSDTRPVVPESSSNPVDSRGDSRGEKPVASENPNTETNEKIDALPLTDREKRKREVEEKLQNLKAKKHNLVQVLKQILNAEEELKRRSNIPFQGMAMRPSVPLQVDTANDSGSMSRHATPRIGSEGNLGSDMEGGEADDVSNHNVHSRHLLRMSSTSPSSDSPYRRPAYIQHNTVPHPSRANAAVAGSPSRFAPSGHQGHPANLPTVSVSGTNYVASSPSPAASGGTSAFRDGRLSSPWN